MTGTPARAGSAPDGVDEAVAVEARHHHVAEHEVGRLAAHRVEGRPPVGHELDVVVVAEHVAEVGAQVGVVLRHDDPGPTGARRRGRARRHRARPGAVGCCQVCTSRRKSSTRRGVIVEDAPAAPGPCAVGRPGSRTVKVLPRPTSLVRVTRAAHQLGELLHHGEPDAGTLVRAGAGGGGQPLEPREGALDVIRVDADSGVAHRDLDVVVDAAHGQARPSPRGCT